MDFPRLQISIFAAVLLALELMFLELQQPVAIIVLAVTALCLAWQLWWVLPYTLAWRCEVQTAGEEDSARQLRILTANVLTPNRNAAALIALVNQHQPDILVTLESDQWWEDQLNVLTAQMPHTVKCPKDNLYGMHVFSRLPLEAHEIAYLVEPDVPSIHVRLQLRSGDTVRMHFLHPEPPSPTENTVSTERDVELLIVAKSIAKHSHPTIVTGDLNDVAWSRTTRLFRKISGLLDPRVGRGMFNTFHAHYPCFRWPLDHIFHSAHFTLRHIQRLPSIDSDHFPLLTELTFMPICNDAQQGLTADAEDHEQATEILQRRRLSSYEVPSL